MALDHNSSVEDVSKFKAHVGRNSESLAFFVHFSKKMDKEVGTALSETAKLIAYSQIEEVANEYTITMELASYQVNHEKIHEETKSFMEAYDTVEVKVEEEDDDDDSSDFPKPADKDDESIRAVVLGTVSPPSVVNTVREEKKRDAKEACIRLIGFGKGIYDRRSGRSPPASHDGIGYDAEETDEGDFIVVTIRYRADGSVRTKHFSWLIIGSDSKVQIKAFMTYFRKLHPEGMPSLLTLSTILDRYIAEKFKENGWDKEVSWRPRSSVLITKRKRGQDSKLKLVLDGDEDDDVKLPATVTPRKKPKTGK